MKIVVNNVVHLQEAAWIEGCKRGEARGGEGGEWNVLKATTYVFVVFSLR